MTHAGGCSDQITFGKHPDYQSRKRDKSVELQHKWRSKRRSTAPVEHERVCTKHVGHRRVIDNAKSLLLNGLDQNMATRP